MRNLEDNLRDAVFDLADSAPSATDLAAIARTRGRRIRRRRHLAFGAVAVALIGVTVTPYAVLRKDQAPAPPPATAVSPSPSVEVTPETRSLAEFDAGKPYRVLGGAVITSMTRIDNTLSSSGEYTDETVHHVVLDRDAGEYRELTGGYRSVRPGPDGLIAVYDRPGEERTTRIVTATGDVRRTLSYRPIGGDAPEWSPDGARLLIPTSAGFAIGQVTKKGVVEGTLGNCPDWCSLSWLPGGAEFAVTQRDGSQPRSEAVPETVGSLDIHSAGTGELVRSIKMTGRPLGTRAWSADGRRVLTRIDGTITITDATDGSPVTSLIGSDAMYLPDGRILTLDDEFVMLYDAEGTPLEEAGLPREFQGLVLTAGVP
jgi:hypothetical protein